VAAVSISAFVSRDHAEDSVHRRQADDLREGIQQDLGYTRCHVRRKDMEELSIKGAETSAGTA